MQLVLSCPVLFPLLHLFLLLCYSWLNLHLLALIFILLGFRRVNVQNLHGFGLGCTDSCLWERIGLQLGFLLATMLAHHAVHNVLALVLPFSPILFGIIQIFITRNTKNTTILEFLCQGNNIEVKKAQFTFVPKP